MLGIGDSVDEVRLVLDGVTVETVPINTGNGFGIEYYSGANGSIPFTESRPFAGFPMYCRSKAPLESVRFSQIRTAFPPAIQ